tara:strand:- start:4152 stop:6032 length:1881 start_codon:yes stop_codon:yes gene_type:complete
VHAILLLSSLFLAACRDKPANGAASEPKPEARISYSTQIRPLLIDTCVSCHGDLPLHNPDGWDLLHQHEEKNTVEVPGQIQKWIDQGREADPHWAGQPLREVAGNSVDDFVIAHKNAPEIIREIPQGMFTAPVHDLIAGDLMPERDRAISTGYLRQGGDTPEWRVEKVAREFLGVRISCAKCHDHPTEHWSNNRYQRLAKLFTTPFDSIPNALPPLHVKISDETAAKISAIEKAIEESSKPSPAEEKEYLNWLALDQSVPSLPGLIAAYSFDDRQLTNLAPLSDVKAGANNLITEGGAHGLGVQFDGTNQLVLSELPIGTELDRFTISVWIKLSREALSDTPIVTIGSRELGFEFRVVNGRLQSRWSQTWPQHAIATTSNTPLIAPNRWSHVAITYDGSRNAKGMNLYLNGRPVEANAASTKLLKSVLPPGEAMIISGKELTVDELQIYRETLTPIGVRQIFDGRSLTQAYETGEDLRDFYQRHFSKGEESRRKQVRSLVEELLEFEDGLDVFLAMQSNPDRNLASDSQEPKDRLEFALDLNQNLLARSLANEVWRRHFGTPLAHSLGFSDPLPSHPDLLEWLAGELKRNDFKVMKLDALIRDSGTWKREWPGLDNKAATCPRETQ